MATIIWKGFEKEPTETLHRGYELITGQNLKPSSKEQSNFKYYLVKPAYLLGLTG